MTVPSALAAPSPEGAACHPDELDDVDPVELAAVRAALGLTRPGASQVAPAGVGYAAGPTSHYLRRHFSGKK